MRWSSMTMTVPLWSRQTPDELRRPHADPNNVDVVNSMRTLLAGFRTTRGSACVERAGTTTLQRQASPSTTSR
jgi:hypothetical protein